MLVFVFCFYWEGRIHSGIPHTAIADFYSLLGPKTSTSYFPVLSVVWSIIQQYLLIIFCCPFLYQFLNSNRCFVSTEVLSVDSFQEKPSQFYILLYNCTFISFRVQQPSVFCCCCFLQTTLLFHLAVITVHVCINGQCSLFMSSMCVYITLFS